MFLGIEEKKLPNFLLFSPKTAFFRQIFSPKGLKRAKSYLKNSQFAPGHWNFSDALFVSVILHRSLRSPQMTQIRQMTQSRATMGGHPWKK